MSSYSLIVDSQDLVQQYKVMFDELINAKERLQRDVEQKLGELAIEQRTHQWLESRLDRLVLALATVEETLRYREERQSSDITTQIIEQTQADVSNERQIRENLEVAINVTERSKIIEEYERKLNKEENELAMLQRVMEATRTHLEEECETVRVLEVTIADLERPIMENIPTTNYSSLAKLQEARIEFLVEFQARQRLERQLLELEVMSWNQPGESFVPIQDDHTVEQPLPESLNNTLEAQGEEQKPQEDKKEEQTVLQTVLKCTREKLSKERSVRQTLEERLTLLEQAVEKKQALKKVEDISLDKIQNDLSKEREAKMDPDKQLVEKTKSETEDDFYAKLDALEKILIPILEQNRPKRDEKDDGGEGCSGVLTVQRKVINMEGGIQGTLLDIPQDIASGIAVENNDLCNSTANSILNATEDTTLAKLAKTENTEQTLATLKGECSLHGGNKPDANQPEAPKPAGNQNQVLEERLADLGAMKKTIQFEEQENNEDE